MSKIQGMKGPGGHDSRQEAVDYLRKRGYTLTEIYSAARPHGFRAPTTEDRLAFAKLGGRTA